MVLMIEKNTLKNTHLRIHLNCDTMVLMIDREYI